jgi:hypothetical protein
MTTAKKQSVANAYKQHVAGKELSLVDVTLPSGFVFKFRKPSAFQVLFQAGELPQTLSSAAVERWIEDGIITPDEDTPEAKNGSRQAGPRCDERPRPRVRAVV